MTNKNSFRILILDDNEDDRWVLTERIHIMGYENTFVFDSPKDVVNFIRENPDVVDLLITDRRMPRMWGEEVIREVKRINPNISTIMLTGDYLTDLETAAIKAAGADDILAKPVGMEVLGETIKKCF